MTPRRNRLFLLVLICLVTHFRGYTQGAVPGCSPPYYKGNYGPPLDGSVTLESTTIGPDASVYIGCDNNPAYSIIKLDSLGNMIRSTSYTPAGANNPGAPGKTITDRDGNLFSVFFNNYILRTDTAGNILSGAKLSFFDGNTAFNFLDLVMLPNGDKVFLYTCIMNGYPNDFLVETSPDASIIRWTKYVYVYNDTYSYMNASILADGNTIVVGLGLYGGYYNVDGAAIFELDAATGSIVQQRWLSQPLTFNHISRYNTGYIFSGVTYGPNSSSFYLRTDASLNVKAANNFPSYAISWPNGSPFLFQAQADGSVYGFYASTSSMALFEISPDDRIQWASGLFGFYQNLVTMNLDPSGIFIGTDYSATDVVTGGGLSGIELYRSSYSGYFPPCTNPAPTTMQMNPYPMTGSVYTGVSFRDTTPISISAYSIQSTPGPALIGSTCTGEPACSSLRITGNPGVCTGSGTFTGVTNSGCSLPLDWSVTGGPGTATIQSTGNNTVSISFSQDGAYMVKALVSSNCSNFGDSLLVHVTTGAHLSLGNDTTLCAGSSLLLHAGNNFNSYTWQDGSMDSTLLVTTTGPYTVTVADYCGNSYSNTIQVSFLSATASPFPANVTKCLADTLTLPLPSEFDSVSFLSPALNARVSQDDVQFFNPAASTYVLREKDSHGCTVYSPIAVQVYPQPALHIGDDTAICPGDSVLLDAGAGFDNFQWSTGSPNQAIHAGTKGTYWVRAGTTDGCILRDTMVLALYPAPATHLDPDILLCAGTTRQLSAPDGFLSYRWNNGSTASTLTVGSIGKYWVTVTDEHSCSATDTVTITAIAPLPTNFLPGDTMICQYGSVTLVPHGAFNNYLWSDGSTGASLSAHSAGLYSLQVVDKNGCIGSDSILLVEKQCLVGFYAPNAFTPNGDGKNDVFRPLIYGNVSQYSFAVYDRWGQQVFASTKPLQGWDGTIRGVPQPAGAYVWSCTYQLQGQDKQMQKGAMLLIR